MSGRIKQIADGMAWTRRQNMLPIITSSSSFRFVVRTCDNKNKQNAENKQLKISISIKALDSDESGETDEEKGYCILPPTSLFYDEWNEAHETLLTLVTPGFSS
ncbi:hypothetical protein OUZ56_030319 [Daphnia magna]|uniref:Uncharacterized protein n=1 Tax=Daphnia magna TaxID=35525 RepID=A0ABQ9ZRF0_9CRUS|nr:hypothetical protein OUZ56_030319 [Daphnia magna]